MYQSVEQTVMWGISSCHGDILQLIGCHAAPHQKLPLSAKLKTNSVFSREFRVGRSKRFTAWSLWKRYSHKVAHLRWLAQYHQEVIKCPKVQCQQEVVSQIRKDRDEHGPKLLRRLHGVRTWGMGSIWLRVCTQWMDRKVFQVGGSEWAELLRQPWHVNETVGRPLLAVVKGHGK